MIWEDIIFIRIFREIWFIRRAWNERVKSWLTRASLKKKPTHGWDCMTHRKQEANVWKSWSSLSIQFDRKAKCGRLSYLLIKIFGKAYFLQCMDKPLNMGVSRLLQATAQSTVQVRCSLQWRITAEQFGIILGVQVRAASIDLSCFNVLVVFLK